MTDGLLENIILLEKRIQAEVSVEQARAEAWQERELAALQSSLAAALHAEKERGQQALAGKKAELQREGEALKVAVATWCQRLASLDDKTLSDVLMQHLAGLLPGGDHDHPHGQS